MSTIQMTTLAILAGRWQAEADSGAGSPDRRVALRECADVLRMMCEMRFEDCPHAAPHRYCPECRAHPCPVGLDKPRDVTPPTESTIAAKCQRIERSGEICWLTPPCPDCGSSLIDVPEGA